MTTFTCPSCGKTIGAEVPAGSAVTCPLCNKVVTVPGGAGMAAPQAVPPTQAPWPMTPPPSVRQGMAITSMVLGILSMFTGCFPILGLTGLILGIVALTKASRRPLEYGGKGFAIAGICVSLASIMFMLLLGAILLPSLARAREMARRSVCAANLASTGKAFEVYANQYQGQYPPDVDTLVTTNFAQPNQFVCPGGSGRAAYNNPALIYSGGPISPKIHEAMHSCYVYIPGQSASSNPNNVLMYEKKDCHRGEGSNVLFVDGSARWISPYSEVEKLVTKTKARLGTAVTPEAPSQPEF